MQFTRVSCEFLLINTIQPALGQDVAKIAEIRIDKTIAKATVIQY